MKQRSLFDKQVIKLCPACNSEIPLTKEEVYLCLECHRMFNLVKRYLKAERYDPNFVYKDIVFVKWLYDKRKVDENDLIPVNFPESYFPIELVNKFRSEHAYDVLVFSRNGGKPILCNKGISYGQAKEICSRKETNFVNSFAGFCISGSYTDTRKGEPFNI